MRVGIVGAGAAGLTTAWLLDEDHDVTLFEKDGRLGGHAHTVDIEVGGDRHRVDAGFQFFGAGPAYSTFNRLLDALDVARASYPATLTVFGAQDRHPVVMPPFRHGLPVRGSLTPANASHLVRFRRFLADVPAFLARRETTVTIAEYIERQRLPTGFVEQFLLPLLTAFWCAPPREFLRFAAYNALYYFGANLPKGLRAPAQSEIPGGLSVYIDEIARRLRRASVRRNATIVRIVRDADDYVVEEAGGERHTFDRIVVATNARQALGLIASLPAHEPLRRQLARFEYFDTTIAIHGDRRLMPLHESAWSVVNARWDGAHSHLSVWSPARGVPIFKSWVTFDQGMPSPLYALATYQHGMITPEYFDAQRRLTELQGRDGLWLAGLYTHDVDSHESAIRSAVTVAQQLAPHSGRLKALGG